MTAGMRTTATIDRAVYRTKPPRISESCLSQPAWTTTTQRKREQYSVVHSGKSEAEVTHDRRLRSTYCTIAANY